MTFRGMTYFVLSAMLVMSFGVLTLHAENDNLNLSNAQVMKIQAQLLARNTEVRTLTVNVQAAREALNTAVAEGDAVRTAMALLSLDAAEKALKNTQAANQRNVLSLLTDSQKQLIKQYSAQSVPATD